MFIFLNKIILNLIWSFLITESYNHEQDCICTPILVVGVKGVSPITSPGTRAWEVFVSSHRIYLPFFPPAATLCCCLSAYIQHPPPSNFPTYRPGNWPPSFQVYRRYTKSILKEYKALDFSTFTFFYLFVKIDTFNICSCVSSSDVTKYMRYAQSITKYRWNKMDYDFASSFEGASIY